MQAYCHPNEFAAVTHLLYRNLGGCRFEDVSIRAGIAKAPVFAVLIVVIGCFQGFCTHGGADSVGLHTTHSVVQSIFLVIVADALFSVAFSALNL